MIHKNDYFQKLLTVFDNCHKIMGDKNADYSSDTDPFSNFKIVEALGVCTTEQGMIARITDKLSRLSKLLHPNSKGAKVKDESVDDTIMDQINYLCILLVYLQHKREKAEEDAAALKEDDTGSSGK